jgi:hypothetical protein
MDGSEVMLLGYCFVCVMWSRPVSVEVGLCYNMGLNSLKAPIRRSFLPLFRDCLSWSNRHMVRFRLLLATMLRVHPGREKTHVCNA